jgi:hypothetical protein
VAGVLIGFLSANVNYSIHDRDSNPVRSIAPVRQNVFRSAHAEARKDFQLKGTAMNRLRGVVMLIAGCFALYEAWRALSGQRAGVALALGVLAVALGVWHLTRRDPKRL